MELNCKKAKSCSNDDNEIVVIIQWAKSADVADTQFRISDIHDVTS